MILSSAVDFTNNGNVLGRGSLKRECLQGTKSTPERGAMRQTSHISGSGVAVAAAAVTLAVAVADGVESTSSSSSLLSSDANWNASVCV